MSNKELMDMYNAEDISESFILTERLTLKQQKEAAIRLKEARKKVQSGMSEKDRLTLKLRKLKFQIEDYLNSGNFNPKFTFSHFLKEYVNLVTKKRKHFAQEIDIAETELSQLINRHRHPNESIMVRLEIHSNNTIPAVIWYKLIEREKEYTLQFNKGLRQQERKYVTNKLAVHIA